MTTEAKGLTNEQLMAMYREMILVRTFEERAAEEFAQGAIPGFVHLSVGQEAIAVGAVHGLRKDDFISPTHRGHGCLIVKGLPLRKIAGEMLGRKTGVCGGKGCSMHMGDLDLGVYLINGVLGSSSPIAAGSALAMKMRGTDQVHLCFFGDGQSSLGSIHEAMNFASVHKLPIVWVCENNMYGMSTSASVGVCVEDIADRAKGYGFPGVVVDGNDVIAVYETVQEAVKRARKGDGPTLVECKTYRWRGHFEGDPQPYRSAEEIAEWKEKDPIARFKKQLMGQDMLTEKRSETMTRDVTEQVDTAWKEALSDPLPAPEDALKDVFAP
ncbi:MAG: thiamine pyrophosphate-dependent dehydrogenase E1 component subunit alpha [Chloroflexota bacterium]|nr:thiamine pyrophosphate-dependent dehydrogenase E1 component subunit alpha [Chloroflexota bacterium]